MSRKNPFVSVIIPTYHDWERLKLCLEALKLQTYPQDRFEVIVINNDPEDPVPEIVLPPNFQIILESKPGSYAARNKGISIAKGEVLAFTDSDCIPWEDWIVKAVKRLLDGAERVGGWVELFYHSEKLSCAEIFDKVYGFSQEEYVADGWSVTANMIAWCRFFEIVGPFNESLMSGGDMEWGIRAKNKGISIEFGKEVVVRHPARSKMEDLKKKKRRIMGGKANISHSIRGRKKFWVISGLMPPVIALLKLRKRKDITLYEKTVALGVLYYLKVYSTLQGIKYLFGLEKPERS